MITLDGMMNHFEKECFVFSIFLLLNVQKFEPESSGFVALNVRFPMMIDFRIMFLLEYALVFIMKLAKNHFQ